MGRFRIFLIESVVWKIGKIFRLEVDNIYFYIKILL